MAPTRGQEAKLAAGKRQREKDKDKERMSGKDGDRQLEARPDESGPIPVAGSALDRRGSRPKAPWPLDTFFGHASARLFGGSGSSGKREDATLTPASQAAALHSDQRRLSIPGRRSSSSSSSFSDPLRIEADKQLSPQLSDLPVTPPDSGMSDFQLPAVADLDDAPFQGKERGSNGQASLARFMDGRKESVEDPAKTPPPVKPPSKNDIFNSRSVWIAPAPAPPPALPVDRSSSGRGPSISESPASPPTAAAPRTASKTSLFFASSSTPTVTPPPSASRSRASADLPSSSASQAASPQGTEPSSSALKTTAAGQLPAEGIGGGGRPTGGHSRKSSLGRANTEEREREEARIRQAKDVEFRLCPSREFLLGEGRHCNVFLGSYYSKRKQAESDPGSPGRSAGSLRARLDLKGPHWKLCAIKRLHADRQSQLLGLDEAFALRRLGAHPNIIRLIDIRDEVEFTPSPQPSPRAPPRDMLSDLGKGLPSARSGGAARAGNVSTAAGRELSESTAPSSPHSHGRSTSDMTGKAEVLSEARTLKRALAAQTEAEVAGDWENDSATLGKASAARKTGSLRVERRGPRHSEVPTLKIASPEKDRLDLGRFGAEGQDASGDASRASSSPLLPPASAGAADTPRLLILLELLPNSLANYTRLHPERVDLEQWHCWAREMTSAVAWLHDRGCIHADLKKENMLLTDELTIKLCDFNSAVFPNPADPPTDGMGLGTPAYGAPELSRATGGPGASSFSFPIDIYSLGAVLYSLATGVEPFSNARSVIEILQRKRAFFESEENSRADRLAVEAGGSSNPASSPASRSNSMRGRRSERGGDDSSFCLSPGAISRSLAALTMPSSPISASGGGRNASTDSLESVASSITTISGRNPSPYAIACLLDPSPEPRGLLVNENEAPRKGLLSPILTQQSGVERRASMGRLQQKNPASSLRLRTAQLGDEADRGKPARSAGTPISSRLSVPFAARPDVLRRASSFGDGVQPGSETVSAHNAGSSHHPGPTALPSRIDEISSPPMRPSGLRAALTPSDLDLDADLQTPTREAGASPLPPWEVRSRQTSSTTSVQHPEAEQTSAKATGGPRMSDDLDDDYRVDLRPYADGHPALILAGGGRLPDEARDLLRSMVKASPQARPTAREVFDALQRM
ncbi:uncharacterized protein PFL1_03045 [Pseudozyma flocculosa PF-1]|uniref:Protein kinase domain-containing protein n=2 Tax=Pseudozyma flocculosa TaxID=84751 RepID=A0A5C3F0K1_9BASI|nr:uncharacterized protein PFL1_03045 [Pseudozyma flocculosa PF-1]EPQ29290.1 hypothetical protein PFL1_03045 [Pseudozyma flocculosa PF-1]SPO37802.1 uncharacterized protein PSFLO_03278 [Pseudozyma flocculosa]